MHVVIVNDHGFTSGGTAAIAISEAVSLCESGLHVIFFCGKGPVCEELSRLPIDCICLDQEEFLDRSNPAVSAFTGLKNTSACSRLSKLLDGYNPEHTVVHYHGWMKVLSPAILGVAKAQGFKSLLTLHDFFVTCPNGGLMNYQKGYICHKKPLSLDCWSTHCDSRSYVHKLWRNIRGTYQETIIKPLEKIDQLLAVSSFCRKKIEACIGPGRSISVLENPVERSLEEPADIKKNDYFIYVGRLSPEKGIGSLLDAVRGTSIELKVVGDGNLTREDLPNIEWLGWLNHKEVLRKIRSARALIFPSVWYETFGLTVFEAMANGVPPIVSDCTASADYIINESTGMTFPSGDSSALRKRIQQLSHDDILAGKIGRQAKTWFDQHDFSIDTHTDRLISFYKQALSSSRNQ